MLASLIRLGRPYEIGNLSLAILVLRKCSKIVTKVAESEERFPQKIIRSQTLKSFNELIRTHLKTCTFQSIFKVVAMK